MAPVVDAMIVVGSPNSSNSQRLKEVALRTGCPHAELLQRADDIDWQKFGRIARLGLTAGASAPEVLIEEIIDAFAARYEVSVETVSAVEESESFFRCRGELSRQRNGGIAAQSCWQPIARTPWPSIPTLPTRNCNSSSPDTHRRACSAYKGIAEGVENSNFLLQTDRGYFILTLYEKRVQAGDLPFFLGLMEHLAARGLTCPQPVRSRGGEHSARARRPAGRASSPFSTACGSGGRDAAHCAAVGEALAELHPPAQISRMTRPNALSVAGWRPLVERGPAGRHGAKGLGDLIAASSRELEQRLAARSAARRHPRRSVSRQCILPRRSGVRTDRFLFRLHGRLRL